MVEMKTLEDAERACERLHDRKFDGTYVGIKVMQSNAVPFFFILYTHFDFEVLVLSLLTLCC